MDGNRGITADIALRLGRLVNMSPQFWMNLQSQFNLATALDKSAKLIERDVNPMEYKEE